MKDHLLEKVRQVETLDGRFPIYAGSGVTIETSVVDPADLKPTAKYVMRENLTRVAKMRDQIYNQSGIDVFNLPALVQYEDFLVSPPIIESGLIVDGLHRCWESLHNGRKITVIDIKGVDENLPPVGLPIDWSYIEVRDEKPKFGWECRELRPGFPDDSKVIRRHFRDYSILGSTGRRPTVNQNS